MNERMIELANKANEDVGYTFKLEDANQIHTLMEKFAELIVRECIGTISEVKERFFKFRLETDDFTEKNRFFAGEDACNQSVQKIETLFGVLE